jgi:hypothetical protein
MQHALRSLWHRHFSSQSNGLKRYRRADWFVGAAKLLFVLGSMGAAVVFAGWLASSR